MEYLKCLGLEVKFHGRGKNEASHYCVNCEVEVFNILFVKEQDKKHVVHCQDCARKASHRLEGFIMLEEYKMEELIEIYDNFCLHPSDDVDPGVILTASPEAKPWAGLSVAIWAGDKRSSDQINS